MIVNKSTVPVGSTLVVERVLGRHDVTVVSNPEFLREGTAVQDSLHPERIVVGADDQAAAARVGDLFAGTHAPLLITDAATAETIKYASNAFLATKLSFVNAVAGLCEAVGADVRDVILGLGYDKRIGFEYLRPGPGWGGSCLPKDTRALVYIAEQAGYDFSFLKGAIATNDEQFVRVVSKVRTAVGDDLEGAVIAVWGLTFKAGTDDLRNSPAVEVVRRLVEGGAIVQAFDPTVSVPDGQKSGPVDGLSEFSADGDGLGLANLVRVFPDAYAACQGGGGDGGADRVGRVPVARLRQGAAQHGHAGGGGCPQPPRPGAAPATRLRVHRHRPSMSRRLVVLGGAGFLGSHLCATSWWTGETRWSASTTSPPGDGPMSATWTAIPGSASSRPTSARRFPSREPSRVCSTWPARPHPPTTWPVLSRPWPSAARGPGAGSSWLVGTGPDSYWPRPARCMATPRCIPRPSRTGAM